MALEYSILGPLNVRRDGASIALGGPKQRTLLALLLLHANQTVSTERMIDELWSTTPPWGARDTVRTYVRRLRRTLRGGSSGVDENEFLRGDAYGYRLTVGPNDLDLHRFDQLAGQGKRLLSEGDAETARARLVEALGLWRGDSLADVGSEALRTTVAARMEENRLAALEDRIDADLELDRCAELIGELEALVRTYPTRDRLARQLMLALYRAGRQVDALEVYRRRHRLLTEEYGCEPGIEIRALEQAVLAEDPTLTMPRYGSMRRAAERPHRTPCHLPPDIGDFIGGAEVLTRVEDVLADRERSTAVPVVELMGRAGIGKSTLAVRLAHRLRERYPDGQLYADLRGRESREAPAEVLAQFLRGLGIPDVPNDLDERARLFRTALAGRRVLVVLDNVADEAQVRPLLPGDPECGAVITSRRHLAGLDGMHSEPVRLFSEDEAMRLLGSLLGADRLAHESEAARAIVAHCGHLPFAVRIAGARLAAKPHWSLRCMAERLADPGRRVSELRIGDLSMRAKLESTYGDVTIEDRRALCVLAAVDLPDLMGWTASAVLGLDDAEGEDILERLADEQLLEVVGCDEMGQTRYRFPVLLRDFMAHEGSESAISSRHEVPPSTANTPSISTVDYPVERYPVPHARHGFGSDPHGSVGELDQTTPVGAPPRRPTEQPRRADPLALSNASGAGAGDARVPHGRASRHAGPVRGDAAVEHERTVPSRTPPAGDSQVWRQETEGSGVSPRPNGSPCAQGRGRRRGPRSRIAA